MRGFREVGWVAAVAGTALGCYMVSLKVASERAALEAVHNRIVMAQRDIRVLQTEIGTRGRLEQLESWNVKVLALSAPQAHQFLEGEFQLATLAAPEKTIDPAAPMVLASAPASATTPQRAEEAGEDKAGPTARDLMQVASLKRALPDGDQKSVDKPRAAAPQAVKPGKAPATTPAKTAAPVKVSAKATPAVTARAEPKAKATAKAPPATDKSKDSKARQ